MERLERCGARCCDDNVAERLRISGHAALAAGSILRDLFDRPHTIRHKGAKDLVTEADVAAEKIALEILGGAGADIALLAEESHSVYDTRPAGPAWIVDPLDGTTNFAHGFPWFAVSIAFAVGTETLAGVVYAPMQDELFCACRGAGAWLNGKELRVSSVPSLDGALLGTGFPYAVKDQIDEVIGALARILPFAQGIRRAGAAALDLACVAAGRLDGFWEINLKPWDTAAGMLLVEEAGGRLTDFQGGKYDPYLTECLASNGKIHGDLVAQLSSRR